MHTLAWFKTGPCYTGVGNWVSHFQIGLASFEVGAGLQPWHKLRAGCIVYEVRAASMPNQSLFTMRARHPAIAGKAA